MLIIAFFTDKGVPKTGLTPTIDIWKADGTQVVTAASMTEIGGGFYKYDFTGYNGAEQYCIRADGGATLVGNERYVYGSNEYASVWEEAVSDHQTSGTFGEKNQNKVPSENIDDYKADVSALALETTAQAIKSQTDKMQFDANSNIQSRVNDKGVLNDPSASQIADAVWDESISEHSTSGTFGSKNQRAVPSENIDDYKADVSSLALESTAQAIKAKTDNLPSDPASQSQVDDKITQSEQNIRGADNDTLKTISDQIDELEILEQKKKSNLGWGAGPS